MKKEILSENTRLQLDSVEAIYKKAEAAFLLLGGQDAVLNARMDCMKYMKDQKIEEKFKLLGAQVSISIEFKARDKCPPHSWDRSGERCEKCGDKDWMT